MAPEGGNYQVLEDPESHGRYQGGECPECNHAMDAVTIALPERTLALEICRPCQRAWRDSPAFAEAHPPVVSLSSTAPVLTRARGIMQPMVQPPKAPGEVPAVPRAPTRRLPVKEDPQVVRARKARKTLGIILILLLLGCGLLWLIVHWAYRRVGPW